MKMDRRSFYDIFNSAFPPELSCGWDNDGVMICRDMDREVRRALVCLDVTLACVDMAINGDFDVIVSHHPLIFRALKSLDGGTPAGRKLFELVRRDIAVFSFHTRMDGAPGGLNRAVADALGMKDVSPLPVPGENGALALIGSVAPTDPHSFADGVAARFASPVTLWSAGKEVSRIVSVCGGGRDFLSAALECGADAFISGDLGYNGVLDAVEAGMSVIDLPHRASELLCLDVFGELIASRAPSVFVEKCALGGESVVFVP